MNSLQEVLQVQHKESNKPTCAWSLHMFLTGIIIDLNLWKAMHLILHFYRPVGTKASLYIQYTTDEVFSKLEYCGVLIIMLTLTFISHEYKYCWTNVLRLLELNVTVLPNMLHMHKSLFNVHFLNIEFYRSQITDRHEIAL